MNPLLELLEAVSYDLWQCAMQARDTESGKRLLERMRNPQVGDIVMEITTYRRRKKRMGFGKLVQKSGNNHQLTTTWTIETPDGKTCDWRNAYMVAIPAGSFEWYPS